MTYYRWYSPAQYQVMSQIDPRAQRRPGGWQQQGYICLMCGSTGPFEVQTEMEMMVSIREGQLTVTPASNWQEMIAERYDLYDYPQCARCGGIGVPTTEVFRRCEVSHDCAGCFLCGRVTPEYEVEANQMSCPRCAHECAAEEHVCEISCSQRYMVGYYSVKHGNPYQWFLEEVLTDEPVVLF